MITVVDYGVGNLGSIVNMLRRVGALVRLSESVEDVLTADKLILPGVGSFDNAMRRLRSSGYIAALEESVLVREVPILGICVGMQMLGRCSEEGQEKGLAWIDAESVKFAACTESEVLKVPHMGWNEVFPVTASPLLSRDSDWRFYFVHSYYVKCTRREDVLAHTRYGNEFASAVRKNNIVGTQFHPEKSHRYGMSFFSAFAAWSPRS